MAETILRATTPATLGAASRAARPPRSRMARPGEEIVGAQARHRVAGQQEHQRVADAPDAGRTRRPHRDAVDRELADLGDQSSARGPRCRRSSRRTTRTTSAPGASSAVADRRRIVAEPAVRLEHATVARDERRAAWRIRIVDLERALRLAGADDFVAGDDDAHARRGDDVDMREARATRSGPTSCGRNRRPGSSTGAPARMSSPRRPTCWPGGDGRVTSTCVRAIRAYSAGTTASAPVGNAARRS